MLIASYFLCDIDNIVKSENKKLLKLLLIRYNIVLIFMTKSFFYYYENLCSIDLFIYLMFFRNYGPSQLIDAIKIFTVYAEKTDEKSTFI